MKRGKANTARAGLKVKVRRLAHGADLALPQYQSADAAGLDLVAAVPREAPIVLAPGAWALIPTGLTIELPPGTEAQVRPRSGLALKFGVTVLNAPGTIDADYRGEVGVILINHGPAPFIVGRGDRIAQMILAPVTRGRFVETRALTATSRGSGGFGSTGQAEAPSHTSAQSRKRVAKKARGVKTAAKTSKRSKVQRQR